MNHVSQVSNGRCQDGSAGSVASDCALGSDWPDCECRPPPPAAGRRLSTVTCADVQSASSPMSCNYLTGQADCDACGGTCEYNATSGVCLDKEWRLDEMCSLVINGIWTCSNLQNVLPACYWCSMDCHVRNDDGLCVGGGTPVPPSPSPPPPQPPPPRPPPPPAPPRRRRRRLCHCTAWAPSRSGERRPGLLWQPRRHGPCGARARAHGARRAARAARRVRAPRPGALRLGADARHHARAAGAAAGAGATLHASSAATAAATAPAALATALLPDLGPRRTAGERLQDRPARHGRRGLRARLHGGRVGGRRRRQHQVEDPRGGAVRPRRARRAHGGGDARLHRGHGEQRRAVAGQVVAGGQRQQRGLCTRPHCRRHVQHARDREAAVRSALRAPPALGARALCAHRGVVHAPRVLGVRARRAQLGDDADAAVQLPPLVPPGQSDAAAADQEQQAGVLLLAPLCTTRPYRARPTWAPSPSSRPTRPRRRRRRRTRPARPRPTVAAAAAAAVATDAAAKLPTCVADATGVG